MNMYSRWFMKIIGPSQAVTIVVIKNRVFLLFACAGPKIMNYK